MFSVDEIACVCGEGGGGGGGGREGEWKNLQQPPLGWNFHFLRNIHELTPHNRARSTGLADSSLASAELRRTL